MRPTKVVTRFKGLSQYTNAAAVGMDEARDLINCMVSGGGFLEKMRVPLPMAAPLPQSTPASMWEFQQGNGTRQIIVCVGTQIWKFDGAQLTPTLIDDNPLNNAPWSCVESNNLLLMANGSRMLKWTGTALQNWGIAKPAAAPQFSGNGVNNPSRLIDTISRAANVVTISFKNGPVIYSLAYLQVGDTISVFGGSDASFNGNFKIASIVTPGVSYTYAQVGPNATPVTPGFYTIPSAYSSLTITSAARVNGVTTLTLAQRMGAGFYAGYSLPLMVTVAGMTDASFNGQYTVTSSDGITILTYAQPGLADATATGGTVSTGNTTTQGGVKYAYAYKNSITQHESSMSDASPTLGNQTNRTNFVVGTPSPDSQVDTIVWYKSLDGGSEYFFLIEDSANFANPILDDNYLVGQVNTQRRGQLINDPPPVGKYLTLWQGHIFIGGLVGFPQNIAYSGYERIFVGRPEESFPPNNRLLLAIGADDVRAMGAIQAGLAAWSHSNEMFMYRGVVEDIVVDTPVNFTAYLDQLPWSQGANSHEAVQGTPHGLLWWASDNSVQLWNGSFLGGVIGPKDISENIFPLLARATDSQKAFASSAWLNYLDREWYCLLLAIDGATSPNLMLFFDLTQDPATNAGIWISDQPADAIVVHEDAEGGKHLLIMQAGTLKEINFLSTAVNGIPKTGLDGITGLTVSTVASANAIPADNYYMRLVRYDRLGGEVAMSDELGPFANGGANTVQISNVPADSDVFRWRVYFGTVKGQLSQYIDNDPAAVSAAGYVVSVNGTPLTFDAPLQRRLPAFWQAGFLGNDDPQDVKLFRDGQLVASPGMTLEADLVDDETYTFDAPLSLTPDIVRGSHYSVNWKARRMSPTIKFNDADFPAAVQLLSASHAPGAQR